MSDSIDKAETDPREGRTLRQIIWGGFLVIALVVGVGLVLTMQLSSPEGVYYGGNSQYYVFTNGVINLQGRPPGPNLFTYSQENGKWVCALRGATGQITFTPTVLGITLHNADGMGRNLFLFRRPFAWIPRTRSWLEDRWDELKD